MLKLALFNMIERLTVIELFINSLFTNNTTPQLFCTLNRRAFIGLDVDTIISQVQTPVLVVENSPTLLVNAANLIFFSKDEIELVAYLKEKITTECQNYEARVIVIVDRYVNETELNIILGAFKIKLHLYVTVLYPHNEKTSRNMVAAFHNPFEMNKNGIFNGTNYLYDLNKTTAVKVAKEIKLTTKYFLNHLNGFPINISTFCYPYIFYPCNGSLDNQKHVEMINVIAKSMNWTAVVTVEADFDNYWGKSKADFDIYWGKSKNPLAVLRETRSSIITDIFLFEYLRRDLQSTECFLYVSSQNTCPVATKRFNPRWEHVKTVFDAVTWTLICSTIFTYITFFRIVTYIRLSKSATLNRGSTLKLLQSLFSVTNIDRKSLICSQQILWPFWIAFIFIITNAVTSSLGMKFTIRNYSKPIQSFEDAVKLKVPVVDEFNLIKRGNVSPYIAQLAEQKVQTECCYNLLFNRSLSTDSIYFLSDRTKSLIIDIFGSISNCPFYKLSEPCLGENHVGYVMHNDFPFMEGVRDLSMRLRENGISAEIEKLSSHIIGTHRNDLLIGKPPDSKKLVELHGDNGYSNLKALSFNDLFLPFVVIFLGHGLSVIILVTEFITHKLKYSINNN